MSPNEKNASEMTTGEIVTLLEFNATQAQALKEAEEKYQGLRERCGGFPLADRLLTEAGLERAARLKSEAECNSLRSQLEACKASKRD